jgi:signal transduction histidine kinase/ActR/RegA family two-component response regulator
MKRSLIGIVQDSTERKRTEKELCLLQTITMAISKDVDLDSVLNSVLCEVGKYTKWIYGEAWVVSHDSKHLEYRMAWHDNPEELKKLKERSKVLTFPPGAGLPGRAWSMKRPEWVLESVVRKNFPHAQFLKEFGFKVAMEIPVITHNEVIAVLTFFVQEQREEDDRLIRLISSIAAQLGPHIQRKRIEQALYNSEEKLQTVLNNATALRKQIEELKNQLYHAQRLESIGTLTGGIAHDFNNILAIILGYGNLLRKEIEIEKDNPSMVYVHKILSSAERATKLTRGLLTFSRKQQNNPKPVNLNELIGRIESLLVRIISEDIQLYTIFMDEDCIVMADSNQIEQVLMNLATNAKDAMPNGGFLTIKTEIVELDDGFIKFYGYGEIGKYVLISVADTGVGVDGETRKRIFEPFFTTKEAGKGTGLGLSIVYGIVKQHRGYINVDSEVEKGTTFKIYIPVIESGVERIKPEIQITRGGRETILLAEDEEEVRNLTKIVLEKAGYKVIEAINGEDAIHKFIHNKNTIHFLMLDVIMPEKDGKKVYDVIRQMRPDIKVLFTNGYSEEIINRKDILKDGLYFITKPVLPDELLRKVREVLDE